MKPFYLYVFLLFVGFGLNAQIPAPEITLFQGGNLILPSSLDIPRIFGHDETGYYALGMDHRYFIEHFDQDFNSIQKNYLLLNRRWKERTFEALVHFHDKIYYFTSHTKMRSKILYVEIIDKTNLHLLEGEKVVMEVENLKGWIARFNFELSRKENKLLIYSQLDAYLQNLQDLNLHMYGKDLTLEWEHKERIAYEDRAPRLSVTKVSETGNVFIVSLMDYQKPSSLFRTIKNRYFLLAITDQGKIVNQYPVTFPNLYIRDLSIEPGQDHDMSCAGFYSPSHNRFAIDGLVYFELDNTIGEFTNLRFHEIEPWILQEAMDHIYQKEPKEMFRYEITHMIRRDNGSFVLLSENQYDQQYDTYLNIMVASFDPGGTLNWTRVVRKRQNFDYKLSHNHSSFTVLAPWYEDPIHIIYNDHIKNSDWPGNEKIRPFHYNGKSVLRTVGVGPNGELSTGIIYRKTRRRMKTPVPLAHYDLRNNEIVIPTLRYKKFSFFKITF